MIACPACAARVAREYRFCPHCGAVLEHAVEDPWPASIDSTARDAAASFVRKRRSADPRAQMLPEHKQVSVLFVDVCDSTALLQDADPEEARDFLGKALELMTSAVQTYGGTVSQWRGDGLVALFGAPIAQEDHALRACLAALKMQRGTLSGDAGARIASPILRVGINSGQVLVGVVGQYQWSYYGGDGKTMHIASRLESMAAPGGVLISAATQRLVAQQLDTRPVGLRTVRGISEPMDLHEVVVGTESSAAAPLTRKQHWAPFVGRGESLQVLRAAMRAARQGKLRVVGLRGEAGIGKSRLIADWTSVLASQGIDVCTTQAWGYASTSAYSTAADLIGKLVGLTRVGARHAEREAAARSLIESWSAEGASHLPAVSDLLGLEAPSEMWLSLNPTQRRRRIGEALYWLVCQRLRSGPFVLVLEDVFLADRESQRLLEGLLPRLEGMPILICVSYRPDFAHVWDQAPWFTEHHVGPLAHRDMVALARSVLGGESSLRPVIVELVQRADGNPFFLEQMAITLIDDGSLEGTPGAYRLRRPPGELRVSGSIAAVIAARVDRLPIGAKSALEAAGVLGDPITRELVAAMQGVEAVRAQELLDLCISAGLLSRASQLTHAIEDSVFVFRHALVREALVSALTRTRLKALHRQAFVALLARPGADEPDAAPALAHHAYRGEEWQHAAKYAVTSMSRAISRSANQEALRLFELGVDSSRRVDGSATAQALELALRLEAIGAMMALGHIDDIFSNMESAEATATQLNDQRALASIATQTAVFMWMRGRFEQGLAHATKGLEAARMAQRRHMQMAAHQTRLMNLHALGRYAEAREEGCTLLQAYEPELAQHRLQPGWAAIPLINLCSFHASTLWRLGDYAAAQAICDRAYAVLRDVDHPYSVLLIDLVQGQIWIEQAQFDNAEDLLRQSVQICKTRSVPTMLAVCTGMLGHALVRNGKAPEAATMLESGFAERICDAAGPYGRIFMRVSLGMAYRAQCRWSEAVTVGRQAVDQSGEEYGHRTEALFQLAQTLRAAGDAQGAGETFSQALDAATRLDMPYYQRGCSEALADLNEERHRA